MDEPGYVADVVLPPVEVSGPVVFVVVLRDCDSAARDRLHVGHVPIRANARSAGEPGNVTHAGILVDSHVVSGRHSSPLPGHSLTSQVRRIDPILDQPVSGVVGAVVTGNHSPVADVVLVLVAGVAHPAVVAVGETGTQLGQPRECLCLLCRHAEQGASDQHANQSSKSTALETHAHPPSRDWWTQAIPGLPRAMAA